MATTPRTARPALASRMLERALPEAWRYANPAAVTAARLSAADRALCRLLGTSALRSNEMDEAAELTKGRRWPAVSKGGRWTPPTALDWPTTPHLVLWHAAPVLREHRGDGHSAVLLAAAVDGC